MHPLIALLIVAGCLLAVVAAVQVVADRLRVPETTLLAMAGIAIGAAYLGLQMGLPAFSRSLVEALVQFAVPADAYLWLFLPPLLFQLALSVDVRGLLQDTAPVLLLAVIAVFVATAGIGLALSEVAPESLPVCLLLGAVVATTDPSAVTGIFRDVGAPGRLIGLIEGESLLNDAAAIALAGALTAMIAGNSADSSWTGALVSLVYSFCGGVLIGALAGRFLVFVLPGLRGIASAETILTLALPYPLYLLTNEMLGLSGVVAVVAAGLVLKGLAGTRLSPRNWEHLQLVWNQVAAVAGALVFLLAALRVPRLLHDVELDDLLYLLTAVAAALLSRLAVLFLMLPLLSRLRLSAPVSPAYKLAMAWGGLRGAVTLVLALGAAESTVLPAEARRFISVTATGFVLFSLIVNGTSLRWLIRRLGLNRLSAQDHALQRKAIELSTVEVQAAVGRIAKVFRIGEDVARDVSDSYGHGAAVVSEKSGARLSDDERLAIGLVILATHERDLIPDYGEGVISVRNLDAMVRNTGYMIDAARLQGQPGYHQAARRILEPSAGYTIGLVIRKTFRINGPLEAALANRFELLLCRCAVLERLRHYNRRVLSPMLGEQVAGQLEAALLARSEFAEMELDVMRAQFGRYSVRLEKRLLMLYALRQGRSGIDALAAGRVISAEVHGSVAKNFDRAWSVFKKRPQLH